MGNLKFPEGPNSLYPFQLANRFIREPLSFLTSLAQTYGDVSSFRIGTERIFFFNHPDQVRQILVEQQRSFHKGRGLERAKVFLGEGLLTSEGHIHLRQRRLMQPAFHRDRLAGYGKTMVALAEQHLSGWQPNQEVDFSHEMMRLTLKIAAKTLFDTDLESEVDEIGEAVGVSVTLFRVALLPGSKFLQKLPLPFRFRFQRAKARLDRTLYRVLTERREEGKDHGDLLSMLLAARDTETGDSRMTDLQLRDELITLLTAGHETTANAFSWTFYLLALHPEIMEKLQKELAAVLKGKSPSVADLPRLEYTRQVFAESLRLYPPAWAIGRRAIEEVQIGEFAMPKGSVALMSQWVLHRDQRFFKSPEAFVPERWEKNGADQRPRYAYFPFGAGTRQCIGEQFAWTEGVLLTALIAQRWVPELVLNQKVEPEPLITLRPKRGIRMRLRAAGLR